MWEYFPTIFFQFLLKLSKSKVMELTKQKFVEAFGKKVEEVRLSKKLSLRQLSQNCDVDHSDISKIEKGERNIRITTLFDLAKGLDIHPRELLDFEL